LTEEKQENKRGKRLSELVDMVGGELLGDSDPFIIGVTDLHVGGEGYLVLVNQPSGEKTTLTSASAYVIPQSTEICVQPAIRCKNPVLAFSLIHQYFLAQSSFNASIHPTAIIGQNCTIPKNVCIAAGVVIGNNVNLGEKVILHAGVILEDAVSIGEESEIFGNVTINRECLIGDRVIIHSGTVIGSDGFGFATNMENGNHIKRPHVGIVQIDDDVEIGSNTSIDRGTFGKTHIKKGTKIDNLVQIAHNCVIGKHCLIAGQAGLAGSATLGNNVILAGQVAVKDHVTVGDGAIVAAKSGVTRDVEAGEIVAGMPTIPLRTWRRAMVGFKELPALIRDIRRLKKNIEE